MVSLERVVEVVLRNVVVLKEVGQHLVHEIYELLAGSLHLNGLRGLFLCLSIMCEISHECPSSALNLV